MKQGHRDLQHIREKVKKAGGPQNTDSYHQADQCGHDANHRFQAVCCTPDKIIVDILFFGQSRCYNGEDQQRDDGIGNKEEEVHGNGRIWLFYSVYGRRGEDMTSFYFHTPGIVIEWKQGNYNRRIAEKRRL